MRKLWFCLLAAALIVSAPLARATIFGSIRGIVHDAQHRPIAGASVTLKSTTSAWSAMTQTDADGEFKFSAVPLGDYRVTVAQSGFDTAEQDVTVVPDSTPILHIPMKVGSLNETATVSAQAEVANVDSVTPTTLLDRADIEQTPGADRTNSLRMITDTVPGAYYTHDMLHMRGGHQVSWLIDGVPIPNTNIASNLGPQIDPKDIDYLEVERGSYDAGYGDRTYGVFNIVPRTGFERDNEAEVVASFGNWFQTNDQINFGGHTSRFAYFASMNGNRSNLGLQAPVGEVVHDAENGYGGFASFLFNASPENQFRAVTSLRRDYYQIPYDPNSGDWENQLYPSSGLRDTQHEADAFVDFSWVRTINPNMLLTVSPFFHHNSADYTSVPNEMPASTTDQRSSDFGGLQATFDANVAKNNVQIGIYGFGQHDNENFGVDFNPINQCPVTSANPEGLCHNISPPDHEFATGGTVAGFIDDKFKVTSWLTLMAGIRPTHFAGSVPEDTINPRLGIALQIPKANIVFRAFYGHYYQSPPLVTASGPVLQLANDSNLTFEPLHGERDEEHQFGVTIPFRGWALDADTFQTRANNFLDHNNIGESNLFFPVTIDGALIRAWEVALRSPRIWNRGTIHLAYSNQVATARGAITGGLICFPPTDPSCAPNPGYGPLDHDQRNTLNVGFTATLPWHAYASSNVYYGSGFTNGKPNEFYPGAYLPGHTTFDVSFGKTFRDKYAISFTALNAGNRRVLLDNSLTFGGFHYNDPREIYVEFRYRFHY